MIAQMQTNNGSFYGRYWPETLLLRRYVPCDAGLAILSFGCSTGEELLLLRRLFPQARLFGCDVDWASLQAARTLLGDGATLFPSDAAELERRGPFDLIVCNSVLLAPTVRQGGSFAGLPFARWAEAVALLDRLLVPGGILQLINSNFPFRFHEAADGYATLRSPLLLGAHFADQYAPDGRLLCSACKGTGLSPMLNVHLAEEGWRDLRPDDLTDTHFQKAGGTAAAGVLDQHLPNLRARPARATGTARFHPAPPPNDPRAASFLTIDLTWESVGVEGVRIARTATRTWFDGTTLPPTSTCIEMEGATATAFFESMLGRPVTRLSLDALAPAVPQLGLF